MGNVAYLLVLVGAVTHCLGVADDPCDVTECVPPSEPVCAEDVEDGRLILVPSLCKLRCLNHRLRKAGLTTEFEAVNRSFCNSDVTFIPEFPNASTDYVLSADREVNIEDPDVGIIVMGVGISEEGDDETEVPAPLEDDLSLLLMSSMQSDMLRQLLTASRSPAAAPPPHGLTLLDADVKVDITVNVNLGPPPSHEPFPSPPRSRAMFPFYPSMGALVPPSPPLGGLVPPPPSIGALVPPPSPVGALFPPPPLPRAVIPPPPQPRALVPLPPPLAVPMAEQRVSLPLLVPLPPQQNRRHQHHHHEELQYAAYAAAPTGPRAAFSAITVIIAISVVALHI